MRSSIILFDLPRVVEELTCNSVDSGATQVYISVNVRACYVKVEDDGYGITRDGLTILGERYATSKIQDTGANGEVLGFRGEALASLSDVSLLEIRTKARGMPNAYCKIMKGLNCLFLGIDDQREAVGTTVVVRDLFYNQPVRRNYMQASPKRVLHSVKKCVLRIALVHPLVLFKVTDIMSEDELLCTIPSPSPLPLISDGFGNEVSSSLQEVVFSDQVLMLRGYLSGLPNFFSTKAFQYLYINSRFVCKGPIHNLLNDLATSFQCFLTHHKVEPELQSTKRHKSQGYPAFLLNLCCPLSSYDLHFEPSKTVVEFKDWNPILSFIEQAAKHFWKQASKEPLQGSDCVRGDGMSIGRSVMKEGSSNFSQTEESECDRVLHQNRPSHITDIHLLDISLEEGDAYHSQGLSSEEGHRLSWLKPCRRKPGSLGQAGCSSYGRTRDSFDTFASPHGQLGCANSNLQWSAEKNNIFPDQTLSSEDGIFPDQTRRSEDRYGMFDQEWRINLSEDCGGLRKGASHISLNCDSLDILDSDDNIQFAGSSFTACSTMVEQGSSSGGCEKGHFDSYTDRHGFDYIFDRSGSYSPFHDSADVAEEGEVGSVRHTYVQQKNNTCRPLVGITKRSQNNREFDASSSGALNSFSCEKALLYPKNKLHDGLVSDFWVANSEWGSPAMERYLVTPQSSCVKTLRTDTHWDTSSGHMGSATSAEYRYSIMPEEAETLNHDSSCEVLHARETKPELDFPNAFIPETKFPSGLQSNQMNYEKVSLSRLFDDGTRWSPSVSSSMTNAKSCGKHAFLTSAQIQDEGRGSLLDNLELLSSWTSKVDNRRSKRSYSAPPFYKAKDRFPTINSHLNMIAGNDSTFSSFYASKVAPDETDCSLNSLSQHLSSSQLCLKSNVSGICQSLPRKCVDEKMTTCQTDGNKKIEQCYEVYEQPLHDSAVKGSIHEDMEDALPSPTKWRTGIPQPTENDVSHMSKDDILSISSGLLHLSSGSLIPESISKDCLENARVLLQLDRKFIPVMAGDILVIIDQHAADERIRLEDLRRKVLSGQGTSLTYLDSEQQLVLPEMGYQLLQKYSDQIQKWGWVCNIHAQCSESFAKNVNLLRRQRCGATLIAVPCVLGINLTDKDLIEFVEQLVETDGSSTIPPSVLRILNFKACRGAIMFGDSLLPSECSIIVEELKATSLCFQCAHGRPTTVPLLNMPSLREQLMILEMDKGSLRETWHGLCRHAPTIERAQQRLESAKRFQGG